MNCDQFTDESSAVLLLLHELISKPDAESNEETKLFAQKVKEK